MNQDSISDIKNKYFKDETQKARYILISINLFSTIIWLVSIYMVANSEKKNTFTKYLTIIVGSLISLVFLHRLVSHILEKDGVDLHLGPDYRICQIGPDGLKQSELDAGAVCFIDYECSISSWNKIFATGDGYRDGAYYITYIMFALVLTHIKLSGKSDRYMTQTIRYMLLFGLLAITASRYNTQWVLSVFSLNVASNMTLMMSGMAVLVLSHMLQIFK